MSLFFDYEKCKKRCWACGFTTSIKWGKQAGKQRYKCKNCGILFTATNDGVTASNRFIWFEMWVVQRYTLKHLSKESGYSIRTLNRYFYEYLSQRLQTGTVFLYLNNRMLYKKNHEVSRFGIPTHYVVLTDIFREGNTLTIIYWDAGRKTLQQVTPEFLKKILFGVTHCSNPD